MAKYEGELLTDEEKKVLHTMADKKMNAGLQKCISAKRRKAMVWFGWLLAALGLCFFIRERRSRIRTEATAKRFDLAFDAWEYATTYKPTQRNAALRDLIRAARALQEQMPELDLEPFIAERIRELNVS